MSSVKILSWSVLLSLYSRKSRGDENTFSEGSRIRGSGFNLGGETTVSVAEIPMRIRHVSQDSCPSQAPLGKVTIHLASESLAKSHENADLAESV